MAMGLLESVLGQLAGSVLQAGGTPSQEAPGGGGLGSLGGQADGGSGGGAALIASLIAALLAGQGGRPSGGGLGGLGELLGGGQAPAAGGGLGGALGGLLDQLQRGGLGQAANSWIAPGQNQSISGAELESVFGSDLFLRIAAQHGVDPHEAAHQLSQVLPDVVDRLTPNGQLPSNDLSEIGDLLGRLGGAR